MCFTILLGISQGTSERVLSDSIGAESPDSQREGTHSPKHSSPMLLLDWMP